MGARNGRAAKSAAHARCPPSAVRRGAVSVRRHFREGGAGKCGVSICGVGVVVVLGYGSSGPLCLSGAAIGSRREFQVLKLEGGLLRGHSCRAGGQTAESLSCAPLKRFLCVCFSLCFLLAILRYCAYRR